MTTTISNRQIRALRAEAAEAGDDLQVACCDIALGEFDHELREALRLREKLDADLMLRARRTWPTADAARAACARVIADAQAQGE
jgi:hypothetical protein